MRRSSWLRLLVAPVAASLIAACADDRPGSPLSPSDKMAKSTTTGATLIECPTDRDTTVTATIGSTGGTLEVDGHKVVVPQGAVLTSHTFTLHVPASNYVEVDVTAADMLGQPVTEFNENLGLTISFQRCTRSNLKKYEDAGQSLRIWYIDSVTNALLEDLGGSTDWTARTVTTSLEHLSNYAVSEP